MWSSVIRCRQIDSLKQLKMSSFLFTLLICSKSSKSTWYFVQGFFFFLVVFCCYQKQQSLNLDCREALAPVNGKWRLLCSCFCFFLLQKGWQGNFSNRLTLQWEDILRKESVWSWGVFLTTPRTEGLGAGVSLLSGWLARVPLRPCFGYCIRFHQLFDKKPDIFSWYGRLAV